MEIPRRPFLTSAPATTGYRSLPPCDHEPRLPSRRASCRRRVDRLGVHPAAGDQPRDHRSDVSRRGRSETGPPTRSRQHLQRQRRAAVHRRHGQAPARSQNRLRRDPDVQCRVVQVARLSLYDPRRRRLEHTAVESNETATSRERQPVQVDRGLRRTDGSADVCTCTRDRHLTAIPDRRPSVLAGSATISMCPHAGRAAFRLVCVHGHRAPARRRRRSLRW